MLVTQGQLLSGGNAGRISLSAMARVVYLDSIDTQFVICRSQIPMAWFSRFYQNGIDVATLFAVEETGE